MQSNKREHSRQDNRHCEAAHLRGRNYHTKEKHHSKSKGSAERPQGIGVGPGATRSTPGKKQWEHTRPNQGVTYKHACQTTADYQTAFFEKRGDTQHPREADQCLHSTRTPSQDGCNSATRENTNPSAQRKGSLQ